jgi:hypothetical protein
MNVSAVRFRSPRAVPSYFIAAALEQLKTTRSMAATLSSPAALTAAFARNEPSWRKLGRHGETNALAVTLRLKAAK